MADTWDETAHKALDNANEPIQANVTNIAKYGAPSVAVVTAIITGILGASWKLDPSRPAVLFGTAIIVAAVVLGIYYAFASDVRTRGAVTIARFEAITKLATAQCAPSGGPAPSVQGRLAASAAERDAAIKQLADTRTQLADTTAELAAARTQFTDTASQLADVTVQRDSVVNQLADAQRHATRPSERWPRAMHIRRMSPASRRGGGRPAESGSRTRDRSGDKSPLSSGRRWDRVRNAEGSE
jgi:hypothetical protein